uniref:NADH dehydrogenase [ubiquinone] 1 beta subcomplex subunit 9-like n=1 Tax=Styela clava TaxID=7725 RepID=UPI00193ABF2F|nr:NADH dehydrogenase [ubiquinone] 1 beta subcomplex subunit 9-like [Styela clava]
MANAVKASSLYRFMTHKRKVLSLYKKSLRHLEAWCYNLGRPHYCYERTLLRARFDQHKDEPSENRAAQLLRLGEEEFWENQSPDPIVWPNDGVEPGVLFERLNKYKIPEHYIEFWSAEEKAMFPDFLAKREKWIEIRKQTWEEEMKILQEWDKKNIEEGVPMTDQLPAAKEKDGYPPFWWHTVTRPLEQPERMTWFPRTANTS